MLRITIKADDESTNTNYVTEDQLERVLSGLAHDHRRISYQIEETFLGSYAYDIKLTSANHLLSATLKGVSFETDGGFME